MSSTLAQLIAQMEGYNLTQAQAKAQGSTWPTIAQVNNNPGNLRPATGQTGVVGTNAGYAVFKDVATGWANLEQQIRWDAERGDTVQTFIEDYAPSGENATSRYLSFLTQGLGVPASTPLSDLVGSTGIPDVGSWFSSLADIQVPSWASTNVLLLGAVGAILLFTLAVRD